MDLKQRGIALKMAKLWQVIALPTSILEEYITCRSVMGLVLHPAGLEPATSGSGRFLHFFSLHADLDAANFGVPQHRRRLFILCDREADPPDLSNTVIKRPPAVADILDFAGTWPAKPLFNGKRAEPTLERARRAMKTLGAGVPFLIVYYGSDNVGGVAATRPSASNDHDSRSIWLSRMDIKGTDIENAAGPGTEKSDGIWQRIHYAARGQTG